MVAKLPSMDQELILAMSDTEWWQQKARVCRDLYQAGLKFPQWSEDRANLWNQSLRFFVDDFIQPELPCPKFHDDWYWWTVKEQAYMNLSPRDHAKTTVHSINRVVWEIACNRNIRFFITFSTTDVAKLILSQIKMQLTQNPRIVAGFGHFNPANLNPDERTVDQDWSQYSITVNRPDYSLKDPTVVVAGAMTNVLSRRADRLYADDIISDKVAFSKAESERVERWYFNDVQPILVSDGQEVITGTPYRKGDFYDQIKNLSIEYGLYQVFVGDAIVNEVRKETLWPERWSYDALMRQRAKMGATRFNRNYRCRVTDDSDSVFPMIWFTGGVSDTTGAYYRGCFDETILLGPSDGTKERPYLRYVVFGVDPAISEAKGSSYFAIVVLGIDAKGRVVVCDIVQEHLGFVAQKRVLVELARLWNPVHIAVESNSYQKALLQGLEAEARFLPIVPTFTTAGNPPELGITSMDVFFEQGRFRIPRGDAHSRQKTDILVEELHFYGKNDTDDLVMALWFAFERMKGELKRLKALPPASDLIFADAQRYWNQKIMGVSGNLIPRRASYVARHKAFGSPVASSPLKRLKKLRKEQQERL
jgi:hypothetical protein